MIKTISRLYDTYPEAQAAVQKLEAAGVPNGDISIVASNADGSHATDNDKDGNGRNDKVDGAENGATTGTAIGAGLGGAAGLLAGLGLMAIPGIGPVVAAGWLASTALGAVVGSTAGAATGGLIGALTEAGVPEEDASLYAEGVRRGGTLVSAKVADVDVARLDAVLDESSVDLTGRSAAWKDAGWTGYDPASAPYGAEEVRKERELYGTRQ